MNKGHSAATAQIHKWLNSQGFPLEMEVAKAFQDAHFVVTQSGMFRDPLTDEPREIDVVAQKTLITAGGLRLELTCVVECKESSGKPLVLFAPLSNTAQPNRIFPPNLITTRLGRRFLLGLLLKRQSSGVAGRVQASWVFSPERIGYGVRQAHLENKDNKDAKDNVDVAYRAVMSAVAAAAATAKASEKWSAKTCGIVFPIVVIGSELYECSIDNAGKLEVSEIECGVVRWNSATKVMAHSTYAYIFTRASLSKLVGHIEHAYTGLSSAYNSKIDELTKVAEELTKPESKDWEEL